MCFLNHEWNTKFSNFILGLSHLISFSISEDRYGVVQKDLSEVISILFALEKVIFFLNVLLEQMHNHVFLVISK